MDPREYDLIRQYTNQKLQNIDDPAAQVAARKGVNNL